MARAVGPKVSRSGGFCASSLVALVCVLAAAAPAAGSTLPSSMAALGDSLSQGWGSAGSPSDNPAASWSTGTNTNVNSHYLRLLALTPAISGHAANYAISGSKMISTYDQAASAVVQGAEYVTILAGTNDGEHPVRGILDQGFRRLALGLPIPIPP